MANLTLAPRVISALASLLTGSANGDRTKKIAEVCAAVGLDAPVILGDVGQIERAVTELAAVTLQPGAVVMEMTGKPLIMDGKRVRLVAVLSDETFLENKS